MMAMTLGAEPISANGPQQKHVVMRSTLARPATSEPIASGLVYIDAG